MISDVHSNAQLVTEKFAPYLEPSDAKKPILHRGAGFIRLLSADSPNTAARLCSLAYNKYRLCRLRVCFFQIKSFRQQFVGAMARCRIVGPGDYDQLVEVKTFSEFFQPRGDLLGRSDDCFTV